MSFEELEAARWLPYLRKGGRIITNTQQVEPMPVITGAMEYPCDIIAKIKDKGVDITALDALSLANEAGSSRAVNVVLMGVLSTMMDFPADAWKTALEECVPQKALEINRKAFALGESYGK